MESFDLESYFFFIRGHKLQHLLLITSLIKLMDIILVFNRKVYSGNEVVISVRMILRCDYKQL